MNANIYLLNYAEKFRSQDQYFNTTNIKFLDNNPANALNERPELNHIFSYSDMENDADEGAGREEYDFAMMNYRY